MPDSLPQPVEEHYRTKIAVYLHWCRGGGISQSDQKPPLPELYGAFEASAGGMGADMNDVMEKSLQQLETSLSEMDEVARTLALNTIRQLH